MYSLGDRRFESHEKTFEEIIDAAYARRERPLCLCKAPGLPVYIAKLSGAYVLKRMPGTGCEHALLCPHHEKSGAVRAAKPPPASAIWEDPQTGNVHLRIGFSLSKRAPGSTPPSATSARTDPSETASRLDLLDLLEFLWERAGLTRWRPEFAGKRTWAVVRHRLFAAAANVRVHEKPLVDSLYIPESFCVEKRDQIDERRSRQLTPLLACNVIGSRLMILIGELKEMAPVAEGVKLRIKHLPDFPFQIDRETHERLAVRIERELSLLTIPSGVRFVLVATFGLRAMGKPVIQLASLTSMTHEWARQNSAIPKRNPRE
jgi:hypothetical protein